MPIFLVSVEITEVKQHAVYVNAATAEDATKAADFRSESAKCQWVGASQDKTTLHAEQLYTPGLVLTDIEWTNAEYGVDAREMRDHLPTEVIIPQSEMDIDEDAIIDKNNVAEHEEAIREYLDWVYGKEYGMYVTDYRLAAVLVNAPGADCAGKEVSRSPAKYGLSILCAE